MDQYWSDAWPPAVAPLAPGGPTPQQVFLTGANPLDPTTWLRTAISQYRPRLLPDLESPAGPDLPGAKLDQPVGVG